MNGNYIGKAIADFKNKCILVVGDIMLDRYSFGDVERISPEAPIPILKKTSEKFILGGAGNVAANVVSLGAKAILCGVVGNDYNKKILFNLLREREIDSGGILTDETRPTIVKHRFVSGVGHQLLRVDEEDVRNLRPEEEYALMAYVLTALDRVDVVIFSDYAKGVLSQNLVQKVLQAAKTKRKMTLADLRPKNKEMFIGVDLIKPNLKEGKEMTGHDDIEKIGLALVHYFKANVMLTRGGDGISVFMNEEKFPHHISGKKIKVFDISGAGDTAIAVVALGLASRLDVYTSAMLANTASAIVVQKPGTATLSSEELTFVLRSENSNESLG